MPGLKAQPPPGKANYYGIEVTEGITWKGWQPGREYTKNITLKNVLVKTQKLKYKVPATRFFSTLYPQPIVLSAGTSYTLPITFRPLEKVVYNDCIEITNSEGTFKIHIRAVLPVVSVEAPEKINFNMCAAHDMLQLTFEIKNTSELVTPFQVDCLEPFFIEPNEGTLEPFSSFMLTATFKPKAAVVYDAHAIIKYGTESCEITQLTGIGKYPHLYVTSSMKDDNSSHLENVIDFGNVHIGQLADRYVELQNMSPVNAPFTIEHPTMNSIDTVFDCHQHHGIVPAMSALKIPVRYTPKTINTTSIDYFNIKAIGNISKTIIKCVGTSTGPNVELSQKVVNFMQVNSGSNATKTVDIINNMDADATFQFIIDCTESPFKFEYISGILPGKSKKTIILKFYPYHPINYYKRVTCLVHQQDPLYLDLVGTCHAETIKPAVLQSKHLKRYQIHVDRGFSFMAPEQLNSMVKEGKLKLDPRGCIYDPNNKEQDLDAVPADLNPMEEFFNDGYHSEVTHSAPHVSLSTSEVNFGRVTDIRLPQQQTITLTNHTKGKLTVCWMGGSSDFPSGPEHAFVVSPAVIDLPPESSAPFTVTFRPDVPNQFFGHHLEAYVYYKSLRDYRMVEDSTHCPPWCLNIAATGNTFPATAETYLPRFHLDSKQILFPAVNVDEATYRTLLLNNNGPTPIMFDFEKDPTGIYSMKPCKGLLTPGGSQVFVIKNIPKEVKTYKQALKLHLNDNSKNTQEITVLGSAEVAEVLLTDVGVQYFRPTCVGTASTHQYAVQNVSRIPLRFEWKMTNAEQKLLKVEPASGIIEPNERQYHTWQFIPKQQEKYVMKPTLLVWGLGQSGTSSSGKKRAFVVRAIGEGTRGEVKAEVSYLDFNTVVVGSREERNIVLYNQSDCSLHFNLLIDQKIESDHPAETTNYDPFALELDLRRLVLPAHSRKVLTATVRPQRRCLYQWTLSYQLITPEGDPDAEPEIQHLCHVLATGVHPCMSVVDARCYGSAIGVSKKQLWELFCLDHLNTALDNDPTSHEIVMNSKRRMKPPPANPNAPMMDFNFSAAPIDAQPCLVQLQVKNNGPVPCEWQFLLPSDLQLELPLWSENTDYDNEELHQMKVMDNKLFTIEPRKGKLMSGESQAITFSYKHIMAGTDRLPVLLKVARGREILYGKPREVWINFVGVTVEPERRYIHFPSNKFMFMPVPIGEKNSPKQIYELYNGGSMPLRYTFDLTPLDSMKEENYDKDIFECLNPVGEISPGQTANIEWRFSPLEAKTYTVDIPIHVDRGDTALVTFEGIGFDKRQLGATMPFKDHPERSTEVPSVQTVHVPGQLVYLSNERISFGNLPLFSRSCRLIALTNCSMDHAVHVIWHVTNANDSQIVTISPTQASLKPGERRMCRITFTAVGFPSFYDIDLICEVMNMTDYMSYQKNLRKWERELQRQREEFTITENDLDADKRIGMEPQTTRPPSGRLKALELSQTARTPSPEELDFAKYKTLPPIKQTSVDIIRMKQRAQATIDRAYWAKPSPPIPFLLHLGVTARTHDVTHFQQNFPEQYKNFYIDRALSEQQSGLAADRVKGVGGGEGGSSELIPKKMACLEAEADVVAGALANIIRGLLDDTEFHEACEKVVGAETPYYMQFVDKPLPAPFTPSLPPEHDIVLPDKMTYTAATPQLPGSNPPSGPGSVVGSTIGSARRPPPSQKSSAKPSSKHTSAKSSARSQPLSSIPAGATAESVLAAKIVGELELSTSASSPKSKSSRSSSASSRSSSAASSASSTGKRTLSTRQQLLAMEDDVQSTLQEESVFQQTQALKKVPEFGALTEFVLENTITNIMQEVFNEEVNITAHPRLVALKQSRANSSNRTGSAISNKPQL